MSSNMKACKSQASHGAGNASPQTNGSGQKVVGPNIRGNREEYQLVMHLQSALFGGVYEAKGRSSGRDFAIKVLHKSELQKVEENNSIEFCEVPLSEIKFADVMRGHEHVMEVEEHFEDQYCHYCVFELCRGGDLLEALKQKPMGFDERHAQFLIRQAAMGLTFMHERGVAMQDVSLENMLLNVNPGNGNWQVKICDPGQAVHFQTEGGQEIPVGFHGLVGKSFRPPELHEHKPYLSTKVDSWCLGWSTFYLLTAQPLFMSADPSQKDADWHLFKNGKFDELFKTKSPNFSPTGIDFIFKLLQLEPSKRMSIADCCKHAWLADPSVPPMLVPKELLPEAVRKSMEEEKVERRAAKPTLPMDRDFMGGSLSTSAGISGVPSMTASLAAPSANSVRPMAHALPTWSAAPVQSMTKMQLAAPHTPLMRVRSPSGRSPRQSFTGDMHMNADRRSRVFQPHRSSQRTPYSGGYVVATAHSPAPLRGSSGRASPMGEKLMAANYYSQDAGRFGFMSTPRANGRPRASVSTAAPAPLPLSASQESSERGRPLWAFGQADGTLPRLGSGGSDYQVAAPVPVRAASPAPMQTMGAVTRAGAPGARRVEGRTKGVASPGLTFMRRASPPRVVQVSRSPSPARDLRAPSPTFRPGFSWTPVAVPHPPASIRAASPTRVVHNGGFAWMPDPASPHASPRAFSPSPPTSISFARAPSMVASGYASLRT
ncbi:unnamed protein product [Effrenium voratum]|uniref:Protein kinase domain-containing protein n=1 Tax=Effrenium voratum TaxID=2562239 RepID=A0AA36ILG2_9DINO|nr:unnamed protein product [Effrenium voratum]